MKTKQYHFLKKDIYVRRVGYINWSFSKSEEGKAHQHSSFADCWSRIGESISADNGKAFKEQLLELFIFPPTGAKTFTDTINAASTVRTQANYGIHYQQPVIEVLFAKENRDYFYKMLDLLSDKNSEVLYKALVNAISNHSVTELKASRLFSLDLPDIRLQLAKLKAYDDSDSPKREHTRALHKALEKKLDDFVEDSQTPVAEQRFKKLKLKMDLLRDLHQYDKQFRVHRTPLLWRLVGEMIASLSTGFLANVGNLINNGRWFFFTNKPTTSQQAVNRIESAVFAEQQDTGSLEHLLAK